MGVTARDGSAWSSDSPVDVAATTVGQHLLIGSGPSQPAVRAPPIDDQVDGFYNGGSRCSSGAARHIAHGRSVAEPWQWADRMVSRGQCHARRQQPGDAVEAGADVPFSPSRPGDLVFFTDTTAPNAGERMTQVGIYVGGGYPTISDRLEEGKPLRSMRGDSGDWPAHDTSARRWHMGTAWRAGILGADAATDQWAAAGAAGLGRTPAARWRPA